MKSSKESYWWKFEWIVSYEIEESLIWKLKNLGISSFSIQFSPENPLIIALLLWLPSTEWTKVDKDNLVDALLPLAKPFCIKPIAPKWEKIPEEDWSSTWKQHWQPDPIGEKLLVLPAWLEVPEAFHNRIALRLDPGAAFGTGSHPTTRLCLEALEKTEISGQIVADLGCGSGILAIASIFLGASKVFAVDIDSLAVSSTLQNARLNKLKEKSFFASIGSIEALKKHSNGQSVDLLLCNILAPTIKTLAPEFKDLISPRGHAFLSGLLVSQIVDMTSFLGDFGWKVFASYTQDEWCLLDICKP